MVIKITDPEIIVSDDQSEINRYRDLGYAVIGFEQEGSRLDCPFIITDTEALEDKMYLNKVYAREHGLPLEILRTRRCIVREFSFNTKEPDGDLPGLFELYSGEHITDFVEPLMPYDREKEYEQKYISNIYNLYDYGMWLVTDKHTGRIIGRAGLEDREFNLCDSSGKKESLSGDRSSDNDGTPDGFLPKNDHWLELGYIIAEDMQGQGLAAEVTSAILQLAGDRPVYCRINPANIPSVHVARKLGFKLLQKNAINGEDIWINRPSQI